MLLRDVFDPKLSQQTNNISCACEAQTNTTTKTTINKQNQKRKEDDKEKKDEQIIIMKKKERKKRRAKLVYMLPRTGAIFGQIRMEN